MLVIGCIIDWPQQCTWASSLASGFFCSTPVSRDEIALDSQPASGREYTAAVLDRRPQRLSVVYIPHRPWLH